MTNEQATIQSLRGHIESLEETIKALEQKTRWIPVSERLPEICQEDCHGNITFSKTVLTTQMKEQEPKSPCDVCRYNPPGSGDGKPCTMCPADATERFKNKLESGNEAYKKIMCHCEEQEPCEDAISRQAVREFVEFIQSIKDNHIENKTPINYGTLCDLVIRGQQLLELPSINSQQN